MNATPRRKQILEDNVEKLHLMAQALMLYETIDAEQIDDIMAGREAQGAQGLGW